MKISFSNNIYMAFGATTINFVTVACSFICINFQSCFLQFSYQLLLFFKLISQRDGIAICTFSVGMSLDTYGYFMASCFSFVFSHRCNLVLPLILSPFLTCFLSQPFQLLVKRCRLAPVPVFIDCFGLFWCKW